MPRHIPYDPFRLVDRTYQTGGTKAFLRFHFPSRASFPFRPALFRITWFAASRIILVGTVILLQPDHTRPRKRLLKTENIFNIRPAEAVNRLIVIPYHANISIFFRQKAHKTELDRIRILILVYHDITEPLLIVIQNLLAGGKQFNRFHQKIVKIQRIILF